LPECYFNGHCSPFERIIRHETALISLRKLVLDTGGVFDTAGPMTAYQFEAPQQPKTINKIGLFVRPKATPLLPGTAGVRLSYNGAAPVDARTNEIGVLATASLTGGTGAAGLDTMTGGKSVVGEWKIELTDLPDGMTRDDVDDVLLLVNYTYATG